jgi:hypothetical protein
VEQAADRSGKRAGPPRPSKDMAIDGSRSRLRREVWPVSTKHVGNPQEREPASEPYTYPCPTHINVEVEEAEKACGTEHPNQPNQRPAD